MATPPPTSINVAGPLAPYAMGFCAELSRRGYPPSSATVRMLLGDQRNSTSTINETRGQPTVVPPCVRLAAPSLLCKEPVIKEVIGRPLAHAG